jgi:large subunit ribosomal protein L22
VLAKVLNAAVANAESKAAETRQRLNTDDMVITRLLVDVGGTLRRFRSATRGRGVRIRKRTHHVEMVIVGEAAAPQARKRKGA